MVETNGEGIFVHEAKLFEDLRGRGQHFGLGGQAVGADHIDITLVELAQASLAGAIGPEDGLDLIAFEVARQLTAVFGHDTGQRHGQVVAQTGVADALLGRVVLQRFLQLAAPLQYAEDQLVALFTILAQQRRQAFHARRLQRLKAVALIDALDHADDIVALQHLSRQKVAHTAERGSVEFGHGSVSIKYCVIFLLRTA